MLPTADARQLQGDGTEEQQTDGCGEDEAGGERQPAEVGTYAVSAEGKRCGRVYVDESGDIHAQ